MLEFITLLRDRYQAVLSQRPPTSATAAIFRQRIEQLTFAESFIRKGQLLRRHPTFPLQIAIIGPTQAGKSSLTNRILNSQVAQVSPLAGYTVQPQGFCVDVPLSACAGFQDYFFHYQQLTLETLPKNRYDCYALAENPSTAPLLPPCVFWDTPDFDSIDAGAYQDGVIRTIALADILILVVSKEKYADQSVWELMQMLETFKQPTLLCLNKLGAGDEAVISRSLLDKWQHARHDVSPPLVPLFYNKDSGQPPWPAAFSQVFFKLNQQVTRKQHEKQQQAFLNRYWAGWLEPVLAEHQRQKDWQILLEQAVDAALHDYQRDYLNHPHHYETFQKAVLELLHLLEIPGLAGVLSKIRRFFTWPVRQLLRLGQRTPPLYPNQELAFLQQTAEHFLVQIAEQLLDKCSHDSEQHHEWQALYRLLRQQQPALLQKFQQAAVDYQRHFQHDVDAAAQRLYQKLAQHPLILNSLRATRLGSDAALMAMTVQLGGIGLHDLFITPAMLSITSLLTESAIGGYMKKVEIELKQQQAITVKNNLFINGLQEKLLDLTALITDPERFGISPEHLHQAQQQRTEKRHGLRFF